MILLHLLLPLAWALDGLLPTRPPAEALRRARLLLLVSVAAPLVLPGLLAALLPALPAAAGPALRLVGSVGGLVPAQVFAPAAGAAPGLVEGGGAAGALGLGAVLALLPAGSWIAGLGLVAWELGRLAWLRADARPLGGGPVGVYVSPRVPGPMAAWLGRPFVLLDPATAADPARRTLALRHELRHHAQGDPAWAWLGLALGVVAWWNPGWHLWLRRLSLREELAVDAAVAAEVGAVPYARFLLDAVATPAGLTPALGRSPLHRRITVLLTPVAPRSRLASLLGTGAALAAVLLPVVVTAAPLAPGLPAALPPALGAPPVGPAAALPAATSLVGGPAPEPGALPALVARVNAATPDDGFELADNELVRAALDHHRERPAFATRALAERPGFRALVEGALAEAGLPADLAAVPFVESGYRNLGAVGGGGGSAGGASSAGGTPASLAPGMPGRGLWMFITPTARSYGLAVSDTVDERLDPVRETEAAMALLADLHDRYADWNLALAAYNEGERRVDAALIQGGSRDSFQLTRLGLLNDYVAQVHAGVIVLAAADGR